MASEFFAERPTLQGQQGRTSWHRPKCPPSRGFLSDSSNESLKMKDAGLQDPARRLVESKVPMFRECGSAVVVGASYAGFRVTFGTNQTNRFDPSTIKGNTQIESAMRHAMPRSWRSLKRRGTASGPMTISLRTVDICRETRGSCEGRTSRTLRQKTWHPRRVSIMRASDATDQARVSDQEHRSNLPDNLKPNVPGAVQKRVRF